MHCECTYVILLCVVVTISKCYTVLVSLAQKQSDDIIAAARCVHCGLSRFLSWTKGLPDSDRYPWKLRIMSHAYTPIKSKDVHEVSHCKRLFNLSWDSSHCLIPFVLGPRGSRAYSHRNKQVQCLSAWILGMCVHWCTHFLRRDLPG